MSNTAYKYKKWDKYAKRIITHQELYFASPKEFNDFFDCQAYCIISNYQFANNPFIIVGGKIHPYNGNPCDLLYKATKLSVDTYGVCCFSKSYDSILMWSHYAYYNRGVCFKFDLEIIEKRINVYFDKVAYVKSKPTFDFNNSNEDKRKWFFYKNRVWKYEREVRGLISPPINAKGKPNRKVIFPKEALKEIIFGANIDKKTYNEIVDLCNKYGFHKVKFSYMKAITNSDSYKLLKIPLDR